MAVRLPICEASTWSIDVPTRISFGSRLTVAPDSTFMRPRCGLVEASAVWLNSPLMKSMSSRCGIIGVSAGPISMFAPAPFAHQCAGSTPFEKNTMPRRSGGVFAAAAPAAGAALWAKMGSDSIHGSARATPTPRRK